MHYQSFYRYCDLFFSSTITAQVISALISLILIVLSLLSTSSMAEEKESPERMIVVKDYIWGSGGVGQPAIIKEITLENIGESDFKNIEIEAEFYSLNDIPLGSLRSTINDTLESGTEKTFKNVHFGIMHAELKNTVVRVVGGKQIEKGAPNLPKDLILVKDWEWSGGQYGTEGILKEITLYNRGSNNYKTIKIRIDYLGVPGAEQGPKGVSTRAVINDILPANGTRTYKNINIGFRHPNSTKALITVTDASGISFKELSYRLEEKGEPVPVVYGEEGSLPKTKKLSLAERYRQRYLKDQGIEIASIEDQEAEQDQIEKDITEERYEDIPETKVQISLVERYKKRVKGELEDVEPIISYSITPDYTQGDERKEIASASQQKGSTPQTKRSMTVQQDRDEDLEPVPRKDLLVRDFKWGSGVPGTKGILKELTLENISPISYAKIEVEVQFFSRTQHTPLGSNRIILYDIIPAYGEKTFQNVDIGMIQVIPEVIEIEVLDAVKIN